MDGMHGGAAAVVAGEGPVDTSAMLPSGSNLTLGARA